MRRTKTRSMIERQWSLVVALTSRRLGMTAPTLIEHLGTSRATLYRDLATLRNAGVPLHTENRNGEARISLRGEALPDRVPPRQTLALTLACAALAPLGGTTLMRELEKLRDRPPGITAGINVSLVPPAPLEAAIVGTIERAILEHRTLVVDYRGTSDASSRARKIAPLVLRIAKGHLYLGGVDLEREAPRTFKVARISRARTSEPFDPKNMTAPDFSSAAVAWSGQEVDVRVRLRAPVARFAQEWPLVADQRVEQLPQGEVIVSARVAGHEEPLRWVLSWGRNAEVLGPPELRARARAEVQTLAEAYGPDELSHGAATGQTKTAAPRTWRGGGQ